MQRCLLLPHYVSRRPSLCGVGHLFVSIFMVYGKIGVPAGRLNVIKEKNFPTPTGNLKSIPKSLYRAVPESTKKPYVGWLSVSSNSAASAFAVWSRKGLL